MLASLAIGFGSVAHADLIDLSSDGTGAQLDETQYGDVPRTVNVLEAPFLAAGLQITVVQFGGLAGPDVGTPDDVNVNSTALGINSGTGISDSASEFDAGESFTFRFNKDLNISEVMFTSITGSDNGTLDIGGTEYSLTSGTTTGSDLVFNMPLLVTAGTTWTVTGNSGAFGFEGIDAVVVPEPASLALLGLGGLFALAPRRRNRQHRS